MAAVMGRGHGGDGAGDPPPPPGFGRGQHQMDVVPNKRTRGLGKNEGLQKLKARNGGRPLVIPFDDTTYAPLGPIGGYFTREASMYIQRNIPLDKADWNKVPPAEKNALFQHLWGSFDHNAINQDQRRENLLASIDSIVAKRYRNRKEKAKTRFLENGGYADVEGARAHPPEDMNEGNWDKAIDFFLTEEHQKRSEANKEVRKHQKYPYMGGTATYSNTAYTKGLSRLEAFKQAHVTKDGKWDNEAAEAAYKALDEEYKNQTDPPLSDIEIFQKVLKPRRGHIRGIGPSVRPSTSAASFVPPPPTYTQEQVAELLVNESFRDVMSKLMEKFTPKNNEVAEDGCEDGEDDEDEE